MFVYALLCAALVVPALSYPSQAPVETCATMMPNHGVDPANLKGGKVPFNITATKYSLNGGDSIEVTVAANPGDDFRGFLIQARDGDKPVGQFSVDPGHPHIQLLDCHGNKASAVTHKKITPAFINSVSFNWKAPTGFKGPVKFTGTIVKSFMDFYINVNSQPVNIS